MLSCFHGWRSDRCADFRADGIQNCSSVLFLQSYRLEDYRTFYGLKIGPLLAEIWPILCRQVKIYTYPLKITVKNMSFKIFFSRLTNWKSFKSGQNIWFYNFILFFYFRPTDCTKKARENPPSVKSTERGLRGTLMPPHHQAHGFVMECTCWPTRLKFTGFHRLYRIVTRVFLPNVRYIFTFFSFRRCTTFQQGCHQSARFEFPDFPWLFQRTFPWPQDTHLMGITWNPERSEEKFCTCNYWVVTKICLEIRDKLCVTSARSFSLTFPDSRQKILKFPDFPEGQIFPWFSLMVATLIMPTGKVSRCPLPLRLFHPSRDSEMHLTWLDINTMPRWQPGRPMRL